MHERFARRRSARRLHLPSWLWPLGCALAAAAPTTGQDPATTLPVPAVHTCYVTVTDPTRWLLELLENPILEGEVSGGSLGDLFKVGGVRNPSAALAATAVRAVLPQIPAEVTVAFPPAVGKQFGQLLRLMVLSGLADATFVLDDWDEGQAARQELRADVLSTLDSLTRLQASVRIRCRDEYAAEDLYDAFGAAMDELGAEAPFLQVTHRGMSMRVAIVPGGDMRKADFAELLDATSFIVDTDDPAVDDFWRWFQRASWGVEVEQQGDIVRFVLGNANGDPEPQLAAPAPAGTNTAVSFAIDGRPFTAELDALLALWRHWQDTPVGRKLAEFDTERGITDLEFLATTMRKSDGRMAANLGWDGTGVHWRIRDEAVGPIDLRGHGILRLLPPDPYLYSFDGATSLAETMVSTLQQIEGAMDQRLDRAVDAEDEEKQAAIEAEIASYYERVGPLRDLLTTDGVRLWHAPTATIVSGTTKADLPVGEQSMHLQLPGVALVSSFREPAGGLPFARRLLQETAKAMRFEGVTENLDRDLGLGVPAVSLKVLSGEQAPVLHAFEFGEHLVLSTSLALSRQMLAAAAQTPRLTFPAGSPVQATAATTGTRLAMVIARLGESLGSVLAADPNAKRDPKQATFAALVLHAAAGLLQHLGTCSSETLVVDGVAQTTGLARFAAPMRTADVAPVLALARRAAGPRAAGDGARTATGRSHYVGQDGRFRFTTTVDGLLDNEVMNTCSERNVARRGDGWGTVNGGALHRMSSYDRGVLTVFNAAMNNLWHDPRQPLQVRAHHDVLPSDPPTVVLQAEGGPPMRLRLSPSTHLAAELDFGCVSPPGDFGPFRLDDYREVDGVMLAHRMRTDDGESDYEVEAWRVHEARTDDSFPAAPAPPPITHEGDPAATVQPNAYGGMLVQVAGPGGTCWLFVDPGVNHPTLSRSDAKTLGLSADGSWTTASSLRIGPITIPDLPMMLFDDDKAMRWPAKEGDVTARGAIGMSLFQRCCAEFDLTAPFLRLYPPGHFDAREADFVPLAIAPFAATVPLQLDRDTTLQIGLTFQGFEALHLIANDGLPSDVLQGRTIVAPTAWSARAGMLLTQWPNARIGQTKLDGLRSMVPRMRLPGSARSPITGYFGPPLLRERFTLLLDMPRSRIALVPR